MRTQRATWILMFVLGGLACRPAQAQEWANKMFEIRRHDFGTVVRGGKAEFEFRLKNIYVEDVHISGLRVSCGCTSVSMKDNHDLLKTYQEGAVLAHINSDRFFGQRGATITVTLDRPFPAEVQLQVSAYIRTDVAINPGSVQFGSVDQGAGVTSLVNINYMGNTDLQILGIKSGSPYLTGQAVQTGRSPGQASFQLSVQLRPDAPAGYLQDHLILQTNDPQNPQIPLLVEGRVLSAIAVSPDWLLMGIVQPGKTVTKPVVVQGKKPFTIKRITPDGGGFTFDLSAEREPKQLHVIPVTFVAGDQPDRITRTLQIETDLPGGAVTLTAQVVVAPPEGTLVGQR
jgi:hypothetical protein